MTYPRLRSLLWVLAFLFIPVSSYGALSAATVWEVRASTGNDNNGGGFVAGSGGTDYSQQSAAQLTDTDLATTGVVTTVTSVTGGFTAAMVGDVLHVVNGTNWTPGFYSITAFTNSNTVTVDRAPTTAAGVAGTGSVGGALATLGTLSGAMVASNKAFVTGAFTTTATITFAQSVATPSAATPPTWIIGYSATRGDGLQATLTISSGTGINALYGTGNGLRFETLAVNCNNLGTSVGIRHDGASSVVINCKISNFTSIGIFLVGSVHTILNCEVTGGTAAASYAIDNGTQTAIIRNCFVHDNACVGILTTAVGLVSYNIVCNNTGASSDGIRCSGSNNVVTNNTIHNNGGAGIKNIVSTFVGNVWLNNIITNNGGAGIVGALSTPNPAVPEYDGNAFFSNTGGTRSLMDSTTGIFGVNPYTNIRDVILTASPYVGPTSGGTANFALNDVPGGGQACRRAGSPGAFPGLAATVGYLDFGAVQTRSNIRIPRGAAPPKPKPKKKAVH